ncbi:Polyketide synthase PksJ [Pseudoalteromonas sp. CIP111854]|uniref:Polyketide synthase PksJ n=2 Tax=Pseudoalteromonas holothuriae TaxID=2963714 RepID=A0A9W4R542_9GAMM|nr:Polyketide synthase PksJ [Pseudoalteromonas sp. CIP111854]
MNSGWYGLSGLLRSVMQESPHLHCQLIGLSDIHNTELTACLKALADNSTAEPQQSVVCYEDTQRKVLSWQECDAQARRTAQQVWQSESSYVISGGLGGLGQIFAKEILNSNSTSQVILLGRSQARLGWEDEFAGQRRRVHYYQVDISDRERLAKVLNEVETRHGKLKGVLHSAGVVKDNYLINKQPDEVVSVLRAKVSGLENLDKLTRECDLELFIAFSSMAGVLGNAGQGDYAAANAYMDGYMHQRTQAVAAGEGHGVSMSIAWPLWQDGGMTVDSETLKLTMGKLGLVAMPTDSGIKAFYTALATNQKSVLVEHRQFKIEQPSDDRTMISTLLCTLLDVEAKELEFDSSWQELGCDQLKLSWLVEQIQLQFEIVLELNQLLEFDTPSKMLQYIQARHISPGLNDKVNISHMPDDISSPVESLRSLLANILGKHIGMAADRIASDDEFEQFGIDSVIMLKMTSELEEKFGSLPKTLFFEYKSIEQLSEYFVEHYADTLDTWQKTTQAEVARDPVRSYPKVSQEQSIFSDNSVAIRHEISEHETSVSASQDIAIIGIAGQYPGASGLTEFWQNLLHGVDSIRSVPQSRWSHEDYYHSDKRVIGKTYAKWGGFIDDFDKFDPLFFNISPREANGIDPQERLFLQTAYHALEDAGYNPMTFNQQGTIGVYVGVMYEEYQLYGQVTPDFSFVLPGNPSAIANRVSFYFNLMGPSLAIDSMCSSSLTTIHLACQSIRSNECNAAIAGGVNLSLHPNKFLLLAQGGFAASQPGCRSFGEGGDGYVPGEGVGAVVLKPLTKAIADNDAIHAIIKGSAINHGGRANGYSVPDPLAQAQVIRQAYENANVDVATISYIEAHGTGTSLGDPIEVEALRKVFGANGQQTFMLGSVKSNIGHCESAAGIAGLTKVLLQMKHATIVPSLHSNALNPNINFAELPFKVPQTAHEWPRMNSSEAQDMPRRAGISAFGAGGSNAHLVIEEYTSKQPESPQNGEYSIVLSAKTHDALHQKAKDLLAALQTESLNTQIRLLDIAYTLQCGREAMLERLAFVADSVKSCIDTLSAFIAGNDADWALGTADKSMRNQCLEEQIYAGLDAHQRLIKQQRHWLQGGKVEWQHNYAPQLSPQKLNLPLYPFDKRRCWYTKLGTPSVNQATKTIPALSNKTIEQESAKPVNLRYNWYEKALVLTEEKHTISNILILATSDTRELAHKIAQQFDASQVLEVDDQNLSITENRRYQHVIDVCGCSKTMTDEFVWFEHVQSIVRENHKPGLRMMALTEMTHQLDVHDKVTETGSMQASLYTMLQAEYQGVTSWTVDIDSQLSDITLFELLRDEFAQQQPDNVVAYRKTRRYVASLEPQQIEFNKTDTWVLPENKVLLITGGTSGLGYLCAKHCIEKHGVKKLVLTGRDVFPDKTQWQHYIATHSDKLSEKIKSVQTLERLGAEVQVYSATLSERVQVRELLDKVIASMGEISGVVHCAGNVDFHTPAFIRKTPATVKTVLEPKVQGLKVLLKEVQNQPLQFVVCYSSISALLPELSVGQLDYAMANYYMDQIVKVAARTMPMMSIQWSSWSQSGMAKSQSQRFKESGLVALNDDDGLAFFDDAVAKIIHQDARGVYAPVLIDERVWQQNLANERPVLSHKDKSPLGTRQNDTLFSLSHIEKSILAWLTELFSQELQVEQDILEPDTSFQEVGVDSILIAQFINRMEAELGASLDPGIIIEHASLERLTHYIVSTFPKHCATLLDNLQPLAAANSPSSKPSNGGNPVSAELPAKRTGVDKEEHVAVIGLGCHFPGANDAKSFWENLKAGKDCVTNVPVNRQALYKTQGYDGPMWGAFMDDIEYFDAQYFNLKSEDVVQIDPLIRQWLEVSAVALNDAGYDREKLRGRRVGVYAGARTGPFAYHAAQYGVTTGLAGTAQNFISNYLAHVYDLRGPNMVVDTACSSALTAVHLAVQSIKSGESEIAVAGGVDVLLDSTPFLTLGAAKVLSPDGRCKTFDESANGIALGEGCGVVILKRLSRAIDDGNKIYAVIEGSAINNDGNTMGITTPNPDAQKQLLELAIADADVDASTISYVETHGTGTQIGDPLELKALNATLGIREKTAPRCGVGSVKSNIGHLLSAAGAASLIKVLLSITNKELPPTLHCKKPNPRFNFSDSGLYVVQAHQPWLDDSHVLRAGISSFGLGGCNAHLIVSNAGIPNRCTGTMEPRKPKIKFNKSRYWIHNVIDEGTKNLYNANAELKEKNNEYEEELVDFFDFH